MATPLSTQLLQRTKDVLYSAGLAIADGLNLNTSSWQPGDPTRSTYWFVAEILEQLEEIVVQYLFSAFLDYAEDDWLTLLAKQVYNVDRVAATFATTTVTLSNTGGGVFDFAAGDITFKNPSNGGKTYKNTTGGHLAVGSTLDVTAVAEEAGSASNAAAGEINDFVTTFLGVTCLNAAAAIGLDQESDPALRQRCRDKLGSLSPNGPADAYAYVAKTPNLSGTVNVTRARVYPTSSTGDVLMYVGGPSGAVGAPDVALVEAAVVKLAAPLTITPTVQSANNVPVSITYTLYLYSSVNQTSVAVKAAVASALADLFLARPIGGDTIPPATQGYLYQSLITAAIRSAFPKQVFRIDLIAPAADVLLNAGDVATLGIINATVNFVSDP